MIYVILSKNVYAAKRLELVASSMNQVLRVLDLNDLISLDFNLRPKRKDVLYIRNPYFNGRPDYLKKIISLAKRFKAQGGRVVDANIARGDLGKGKWADYKKLKKAGLPIPRTVIARSASDEAIRFSNRPEHCEGSIKGLPRPSAALGARNDKPYPFIAKWIFGLKAKGTFLVNLKIKNQKLKFQDILAQHPRKEWMVQEYIEADYEYKVITVGYKALPVILRFKFNKKLGRVDFGSYSVIASESSSRGIPYRLKTKGSLHSSSDALLIGRDDKVSNLIKLAERASKTLGRELAKVDILEKAGKFYILEVNRFPGLESFEKLTKYSAFSWFVKYLRTLQK